MDNCVVGWSLVVKTKFLRLMGLVAGVYDSIEFMSFSIFATMIS